MWVEIILMILSICVSLHIYARTHWKRRGIFQPDGSIIFGNIKDILFVKKSLHTFTYDIYRKHNDHKFVGIYSFYTPMLLVTDPDAMKQINVTDFKHFTGPPITVDKKVDPMMYYTPSAAPDAEIWKEWRGLHVAVLTPAKLKILPEMAVKFGQHMINYIKERKDSPVKVREITDFFSIDAVCNFTYGFESSAFIDANNPFRTNVRDDLFDSYSTPAINSFFLYPFVARFFKYKMVTQQSNDYFLEFSKKMMEFKKANPSGRLDFFEHMIKLNFKRLSEGKPGIPMSEIAAHALNSYVDSFFTTSIAFAHFLLKIASYQDVQEKLRKEILRVGNKMEEFDFEKINNLSYLQMALTENLRIHTPIAVSARTCVNTTTVEGVKIEKGTKVLLPFSSFHKDPRYFTDPEKYNPERYETGEPLVKGALVPFGDGPRMCLGSRYGPLVIKLGIIYLLLNFKISQEEVIDDSSETKVFPFDTPDETATVICKPL